MTKATTYVDITIFELGTLEVTKRMHALYVFMYSQYMQKLLKNCNIDYCLFKTLIFYEGAIKHRMQPIVNTFKDELV